MAVGIFHGDKGGVGKSTICATYGEYVLAQSKPLAVIECDTQNPDVARYFKDHVKVYQVDLRAESGWVELFNVLNEEEADDIIVSLPAGIGTPFANNASDLLAALEGTKRKAAIFWTLGRTADSIALLRDVLNVYGRSMPIVAVKNLYHTGGNPALFTRWDGSNTRKELLAGGGVEINFPDMMDGIFDATFGAVPPVRFLGGVSRFGERMKLDQWLKASFDAFETISGKIGTGKR